MMIQRMPKESHDVADHEKITAGTGRIIFIKHLADYFIQIWVGIHFEPNQTAFILAVHDLPEKRGKIVGGQQQ